MFDNLGLPTVIVNVTLEILQECRCTLGYQGLCVLSQLCLESISTKECKLDPLVSSCLGKVLFVLLKDFLNACLFLLGVRVFLFNTLDFQDVIVVPDVR
jgi:hypothetical protein